MAIFIFIHPSQMLNTTPFSVQRVPANGVTGVYNVIPQVLRLDIQIMLPRNL